MPHIKREQRDTARARQASATRRATAGAFVVMSI